MTAASSRNEKRKEGEWVPATKTKNFMNQDPILDWLELYGDELGFLRDTVDEKYDANLDFVQLLFRKGKEFEKIVIDHLKEKFGAEHFVTVAKNHEDSRDTAKQEETLQHTRGCGLPKEKMNFYLSSSGCSDELDLIFYHREE